MIYDIDFKDDCLQVKFYGTLTKENSGIGSYEFWGMKGYDAGVDYYVIEDIDWNKEDFNDEQNAYINGYLDMYYSDVERELINWYKDY